MIALCAALLYAAPSIADPWTPKRKVMVDQQLKSRDIRDRHVLQAMGDVPRHLFVPAEHRELAYEDSPLPIGESQTISQPYIVAFMTQAALLKPTDRVLEIGTGSGYQAAILSRLVKEVYTIEIIESLSKQAQKVIGDLKYGNIRFRVGDGYRGWPEAAPFDAILVTAAPDHVPQPLVDQLKAGGRLVLPVGDHWQELLRIVRTEKGTRKETLLPVRFVPMTGEAQKPRPARRPRK